METPLEQYPKILSELKSTIRQSRLKATLSANAQMLMLYWKIGKTIVQQQEEAGWGKKIIDQLASDRRKEFPDMQGLSPRNLLYMRQFSTAFPDFSIAQQVVAQLPWSHHVVILDKIKDPRQNGSLVRWLVSHKFLPCKTNRQNLFPKI